MRNWGGNHVYRAARVHRPATFDELRRIVARAPRIRALGARHAFSDIADSEELVSLEALPADVSPTARPGQSPSGRASRTARSRRRWPARGGAANLASLPHIAVAGAIATATHGSGDATATSRPRWRRWRSSPPTAMSSRRAAATRISTGLVVGLGAAGVVTRVTLDAEPAYEVSQRVFEGLAWDALVEHFDAITAAGDSVSVFTRWGDARRPGVGEAPRDGRARPPAICSARAARRSSATRSPAMDPVNCTRSSACPGPGRTACRTSAWGSRPAAAGRSSRSTTSARSDALAAIEALRGMAGEIGPLL